MNEKLYKIWLLVNPVTTLWMVIVSQFVLALLLHFIVLSTDLNWLDDNIPVSYQALGASAQK